MQRIEYPRPQFVRKEWLCLNGIWEFSFDDNNEGLSERWELRKSLEDKTINVPFAFQSSLSGIGDGAFHDYFWYKRKFTVPAAWNNKEVILHFGAVDYGCTVFINGYAAGSHCGGSTGFSLNISRYLSGDAENDVTLYVSDPSGDETIPRGKQSWTEKPHSIWYTRTSGIWQTVWLEALDKKHLGNVRISPDIDEGSARMEFEFPREALGARASVEIRFRDELVLSEQFLVTDAIMDRGFDIFGRHIFRTAYHNEGSCWSPESPSLYDADIKILDGERETDSVSVYFGMRKIHTENGAVYLNNRPYYQKLVLDQGYWPESLLTAPSDDAFVHDITVCKEMGFNGCRKHQKVEDPRFLYWADKLGFLVWGEIPSAPSFHHKTVGQLTNEFLAEVERDYNHPCIVAWVPLNESWGVPDIRSSSLQQNHSLGLYHTIRSVDSTRLVISNDGWQMTKSDICAIHNYRHGNKDEPEKQRFFAESIFSRVNILSSRPAGKPIYVDGFSYRGEPILLTEFGGIAFSAKADGGWGYTAVDSREDFLEEYGRLIRAVYASETIAGFCYTQLADVEQEINGLLDVQHKPKLDPALIAKINKGWRRPLPKQD